MRARSPGRGAALGPAARWMRVRERTNLRATTPSMVRRESPPFALGVDWLAAAPGPSGPGAAVPCSAEPSAAPMERAAAGAARLRRATEASSPSSRTAGRPPSASSTAGSSRTRADSRGAAPADDAGAAGCAVRPHNETEDRRLCGTTECATSANSAGGASWNRDRNPAHHVLRRTRTRAGTWPL